MVAAVGTSVGLPMNTTSCCGPVERQDGGKWGSWSWTLPRWFEIGSIKSLLPVREPDTCAEGAWVVRQTAKQRDG